MKSRIPLKILIVLSIFAAGVHFAPAQSNPAAPANPSGNENLNKPVMSEDDQLPFMQAERKPEMQEAGSGGLILRTFGSMILIVGLIFLAAWGLKKYGFAGLKPDPDHGGPVLSIVSTVALGNNRSISTIRFGERILLVGSTAQTFTLLAEEFENSKSAEDRLDVQSPRSVAEMLADAEPAFARTNNFGEEYERAQFRLQSLEENGGKI